MGYYKRYLESYGEDCVIKRDSGDIHTKISKKRATTAIRDYGAREAYWEGLAPMDSGMKSGDIIIIRGEDYLSQSVMFEPSTKHIFFHCVKCNSTLIHQRKVEKVDSDFNISTEWENMNGSLKGFGEIVTSELRQRDPGLIETARYIFQFPKYTGDKEVRMLDRVIYEGRNYKVEVINEIGMVGVVRIQVSQDNRN